MRIGNGTESDRRHFLKISALGAVSSPVLLASASKFDVGSDEDLETESNTRHRIRKLSLLTATPLPRMAEFYKNVLEMKVLLTVEQLVVDGGKTQITFRPAPDQSQPFYHFAFNIPENKILSARNWLGERTELAVTPESQRDKDFPSEIMPFDFWNAHSIFFWDPAGNILELICRHELKNSTNGGFRSDEILYASEIGFVTDDVDKLAGQIKTTFQLEQYREGGSSFRAIGDESGLLILFKRGGVPLGAKEGQSWQIHPTDVTVQPELILESETDPHSFRTSSAF